MARQLVVVLLGLAANSLLHAQGSTRADDLAPGRFLVASRNLGDPNFADSVVLLVQYNRAGAMGLIINRRSRTPVSRVLDDIPQAKSRNDPAFGGGPVGLDSVFALVRSGTPIAGAKKALSDVYLLTAPPQLEKALEANPDARTFRLYVGYAGWGAGQLDHEVQLGGWRIYPASAASIFDPDPSTLWERLIRQAEMRIAQAVRH